MFDSLIFAYSYQKIILNNEGVPIDYTILDINKTFEEITGYKKKNVINKNVSESIPDILNCNINWIEFYGEVALTGKDKVIEGYFEGTDKWYKIHAYSKEKMYFTTVFIDISDIKRAELEMSKANRVKSDFLANISHEIRTPMNGILGFTDILMDVETDETKKEYIKFIQNSSYHLLAIMNDILSLSKIESLKYKIIENKVNIYEKMKHISRIYKQQANLKKIIFELEISENLDKEIIIDYNSSFRIINNLLSNSIKFTKKGYVKLSINDICTNNYIEIIVEDSGIGINDANMEKMFEAFEQGEHYLTKEFGGLGLGLTLVKKIVDLLHGKMEIESKLDEGTKIKIIIPYKEDTNDNI